MKTFRFLSEEKVTLLKLFTLKSVVQWLLCVVVLVLTGKFLVGVSKVPHGSLQAGKNELETLLEEISGFNHLGLSVAELDDVENTIKEASIIWQHEMLLPNGKLHSQHEWIRLKIRNNLGRWNLILGGVGDVAQHMHCPCNTKWNNKEEGVFPEWCCMESCKLYGLCDSNSLACDPRLVGGQHIGLVGLKPKAGVEEIPPTGSHNGATKRIYELQAFIITYKPGKPYLPNWKKSELKSGKGKSEGNKARSNKPKASPKSKVKPKGGKRKGAGQRKNT